MISILPSIETLLAFIVVIGIIVFVHELGHFLAAKLSGVRVEVFSLGFPPKMISKKIGETEYQIAWIPLGGFVKMSGMIDEAMDDSEDLTDPRGFTAQPIHKKILIITAGVMMNFFLAALLFGIIMFSQGVGTIEDTLISNVATDSPAYEAGITSGDKIIQINDQPVTTWDQLTGMIREHPDVPIIVTWERDNETMTAEMIPIGAEEFDISTGNRHIVGKLGIVGTPTMKPVGLGESAILGVDRVIRVLELNVLSIRLLVTGKAKVNELTGPLGIAKLSGESARSGIITFLGFIAFISASIGFLNILPIPMLDGGHLVFIIIEGIIGKPIPETVKLNLMKVGLALLLLLIVVVSYHDIIRIFTK